MRKTKSKTVAEWVTSAIDPDVEFLIKPLSHRESSHAKSKAGYFDDGVYELDGGTLNMIAVGFALKDIRGINNPDGTPFKLSFKNYKMGTKTDHQIVAESCLELIDDPIFNEISDIVWNKTTISETESKEQVFTLDSSTPECLNVSTVTGMSPTPDVLIVSETVHSE